MLKLAVLIPDTHRPFHDKKAYALLIQVCVYLYNLGILSEIVILGDYADVYNLTGHGKDAGLVTSLVDEIEDVNDGLDELDKLFPKAKKIYIQGNHEYRFERYINNKCPELFGVTQFDFLLNIAKRPNWKYIHYGPNQKYKVLDSYLTARHEPLASSAKATAAKALCSLVYGHIHRIEESHLVGLDGSNHVCFSVGWLGDKSLDKVFGYVKSHHQWQLGFGLVYVDDKSGYFYHQKIHILDNYTCVVNGKIFKG
jgi:predicted MPP superfamily phosphohydrolase